MVNTMRLINNPSTKIFGLAVILLTASLSGCNDDESSSSYNNPNNTPAELTVISTNPNTTATAVPTNNSILATFSEAMNASTLSTTSFTLVGDNEAPIVGVVSLDTASNTAIFKPTSDLSASILYTASLTTAVKSATGKSLAANYVWSFTSGTLADTTAPSVSATTPSDTVIDVAPNRSISAAFDESLNPASISPSSFTLTADAGATSINGIISYADKLLTFKPSNNLAVNTLYTATLSTSIADLADNPLAASYSWTFTTGASLAAGPKPVNLLSAANFVILSKTGITNVPVSNITGNIGASPITATAMDNITCTEITGTIYGSDAAYTGSGDISCFKGAAADITLVANAVLDMGTAYNDAKGRLSPDHTELHAGDISGKTLVPGLYKWGTNVLINTDVTLASDANDVWIFQIAGDVIQAADTSVILSGGAVAKNIFWQVEGGTGVALDTNASFTGIVLAEKGITVNTGTAVNGRLFSQTAVTLNMNTITQPAP